MSPVTWTRDCIAWEGILTSSASALPPLQGKGHPARMHWFREGLFAKRHSIRWHIIVLFSLSTTVVFLLAGIGIYLFVSRTMQESMMEKLAENTRSVREVVESATQLAIRNHLQTIAHTNIETLRILENQVRAGSMHEFGCSQAARHANFPATAHW